MYFYLKSGDDFKETISLFSAASSLADISEGKDKNAYLNKADMLRKILVRHLNENRNTCFEVAYKGESYQLLELLKGCRGTDSLGDTIDLASSVCLDEYFNAAYPDFPVMKTKITRRNIAENVRSAIDHFAGRKTQQSVQILQSFGILDGDKIRPEGSKYASYYINMVRALPPQGVLNYSDIFEQQGLWQVDKKFRIWHIFTPIIFLSMVYAGYCVITLNNGQTITASALDMVPKINAAQLYEFRYLSRPAQISVAELKKLFDALNINPALLDNPNDREKGVEELLKRAQELCNCAVLCEHRLEDDFELWGEPLVSPQVMQMMRIACAAVKKEFGNYPSRFNTPAKLSNFRLSTDQVEELAENIRLLSLIPEYVTFKTDCSPEVAYISGIEYIDLGTAIKSDIENAKARFRDIRGGILNGAAGSAAARTVCDELEKIKEKYIGIYFEAHKRKRLGISDAKRVAAVRESRKLYNLRSLRRIDILSGAKLTEIERELASLRVCYDLTPAELKQNPVCPHCRYSLEDKTKDIYGQPDNIERRIDELTAEWTKMLLGTISDPLVSGQKKYLNAKQVRVIDDFAASGELPGLVDDFFVACIQALLKNYEPVVIEAENLMQMLEQLPPMDEASFKAKLNDMISAYTAGKDASTLRITVKRREG